MHRNLTHTVGFAFDRTIEAAKTDQHGRIGDHLKNMNKNVLLTLSCCFALVACGRDPAPQANAPASEHALPTLTVAEEPLPEYYQTSGSVVSDERVEVSSRITAYIRSLDVREGQQVRRGQRLATLESRDLAATIQQSEAQRERAESERRDADKSLSDATALLEIGAISAVALRKAQLERDVAEQNVASAMAAVLSAQAQLQYTDIISPLAGTVVARNARTGDLITPGAPIVTVESDTALLFETYVAESQVHHVAVGDTVDVDIDATGKSYRGRIIRRVFSGDPVTRRYQVKIQIDSATEVAPGMFGRSTFRLGMKPGLTVPDAALTERGGLTGVFVVGDEARLQFRWVRTGRRLGGRTEVTAGLRPGEVVLAQVTALVRDGDRLSARAGAR